MPVAGYCVVLNCKLWKPDFILLTIFLAECRRDIAVVKGRDITKEGINAAMKAASNETLGYTEDPIVSSDVIGIRFGSLFDATQTLVGKLGEELYQVQVVAWYDNENSYTSQMVRTIRYFAAV